ncbi:MAG TPA: N-acetylmuramoyl-L-alanine amidase, partial [Mycobacteriales bacterium]|nr:N-acetylmuramoyl-L-alanine amidase [Mycobacteriales bacterium]
MPAALLRRAVALSLLALLAPALPTVAAPAPAPGAAAVRSTSLLPGPVRLESGIRLVGVTWSHGAPEVTLRWRTAAGWGPWLEAHDDSATPSAVERRGAVAGTEPLWRPRGADLVQVRLRGTARGARLVLVGDGGSAPRQRQQQQQQTAYAERRDPVGLLGDVGLRADWGADESMRDGAPSYAERVHAVVVHHTVQTNDYTEADVPAMIRADYAYHVRSRGWTDLGYNLLVDRFGRIWEGRAGGIGSAVIGSHAQGFNTGTLGVAYLGDASSATPPLAVVRALGKVAAYAAVTWRFDPAGSVVLTSRGS